ncbi:MAG: hypothetical protein GX877_02760 [Bacteroidales bacterium]|nr:hypothetical protein [Bacteroidales bacterium]
MFLNNLYSIEETVRDKEAIRVKIRLNDNSQIYEAHFPGNPITPGACLVEIGRELSAIVLEKKFLLEKANHIKFLKGIHPNITPAIDYLLYPEYLKDEEVWKVRIDVADGNEQMTKMILWLKEVTSV